MLRTRRAAPPRRHPAPGRSASAPVGKTHEGKGDREAIADSFPPVLLSQRRVRPGSLVLFDLDDTLIVATEVSRSQPLVQSHSGYATVVHISAGLGRPTSDFFVAVRPLALASIVTLLDAGFRVGFWSAGTPSYVRAIVQRLMDGVRHMQIVKRYRRQPGLEPSEAVRNLFTPTAVIALDQSSMVWTRDVQMEAGLVGDAFGSGVAALSPARIDASLGTAIKETGKLAPLHAALARAAPHILLVDNLAHDPSWTLQVRHFVPGREPSGEGFGTAAAPDTVIADVARALIELTRS